MARYASDSELQQFARSCGYVSMETNTKDFFEQSWVESWTYIKTVVDVMREPVLILDKDLHVMAANECFYQTFQVEQKNTEKKSVYELGNGQWNIPSLRKLLEDILPKNTFFKGFEVAHDFPSIGHKIMILNARQIHSEKFPPIIMLAMEDVTEMMAVAEALALRTNQFEAKLTEQTQKLGMQMERIEREMEGLRK